MKKVHTSSIGIIVSLTVPLFYSSFQQSFYVSQSPVSSSINETPLLVPTITSNTSTNQNDELFSIANKKTRFCLIHVGKTAGSKVSCELGLDYNELKCHNAPKQKSPIQRAFAGRFHMHGVRQECQSTKFQAFLYTLRNPVDRLVSWFWYEHPAREKRIKKCRKIKKFHKFKGNRKGCFASLEDFAINTIPPNKHATKCQQLAFKVASGETPCGCGGHNALGYDYYRHVMETMKKSSLNYTMLALRSEHLAQDWDKLEKAFGGYHKYKSNSTIDAYTRFSTRSGTIRRNTTKSKLSFQGRMNLCRALCKEIQVYKWLLFRAKNLNEQQVQESLDELLTTCPEETSGLRVCNV